MTIFTHHDLDTLIIPTSSPTKRRMSTISMQNLWGLRYCSIMPLSCLFDRNKLSFTLSTYVVRSSIFLSDWSISSPVYLTFFFHYMVLCVRSSSLSSIAASVFFHLSIAYSYIWDGSAYFFFFVFTRYVFLSLPSVSRRRALADVKV